MRTRRALHYAAIQCEVREVDLKDKPQALLDISTKATVPVLQLPDDRIMTNGISFYGIVDGDWYLYFKAII